MKEQIKTVYRCDFCNRAYFVKSAATKHELRCGKNPVNSRACFGCKHLTAKESIYEYDRFDGAHTAKATAPYCQKKQLHVYPPQLQMKGGEPYAFLYLGNEPMPKKCEERD